jgi:hypothetical protein
MPRQATFIFPTLDCIVECLSFICMEEIANICVVFKLTANIIFSGFLFCDNFPVYVNSFAVGFSCVGF